MIRTLLISIASTACLSAAAHAQQIVEASDGGVVTGYVSASGITRLRFTSDAAASVQMAEGGEGSGFSVQHEPTTGDLYLTLGRLPRQGEAVGAASFFVTTRAGYTYQVELAAKATPSTQIEVRNPDLVRRQTERALAETSLDDAVVALIRAMWAGALLDGYEIKRLVVRERAAGTLRLAVRAVYEGEALQGRVLTVRNPSRGDVTVEENLFLAPGVAAVTIKGPRVLGPGASVPVLIVDRGQP